jgi:hypothetical protein
MARTKMKNGIALTQWLYSGADEHALAEEMAARTTPIHFAKQISQIRQPSMGQLRVNRPIDTAVTEPYPF